jgi:serine/threonine-protein kinase
MKTTFFKLISAAIIITAITMTACGQGNRNARNIPEDWQRLDSHMFSIQHPDTFEMDISTIMQGLNFVLSAPKSSPDDLFRENISLAIQNLGGLNISLDYFVDFSKNQIEQQIFNGYVVESKRVRANNSEFHLLIYTGRHGHFNLKWMQHIMIKNERAYVLTFTAEQDRFDNYAEVAAKIMNTFKIR